MSKKILIPSNKKMIYDLSNKVDGFILGVNDLSVNLPITFSINDIDELIYYLNSNNKDIFISLNKNMHNGDLELLKEVLIHLNNKNITGVMYYDISVVNLKKKLNLFYDLVWSQEHLATNSCTTNFWYSQGAKYTYLSSEITVNEIEQIKTETKSKILVNIFGYLPIFTSKRHLIDNYLRTFEKDKNGNQYYMFKEGNTYPITDDKNGTVTYSSHILNGIKDYNMDVDYIVLNSYLIGNISEVLDMFNSVNESNKEEYYETINKMFNNTDEGFLHRETIYKVK